MTEEMAEPVNGQTLKLGHKTFAGRTSARSFDRDDDVTQVDASSGRRIVWPFEFLQVKAEHVRGAIHGAIVAVQRSNLIVIGEHQRAGAAAGAERRQRNTQPTYHGGAVGR